MKRLAAYVVTDHGYRRTDLILKALTLALAIGGFYGLWRSIRSAGRAVEAQNKAVETQNRSLRIQNLGKITDWVLNLDRVFLERPHLLPYFEQGIPIREDHEHYREAMVVAETMMDVQDTILEMYEGSKGSLPNKSWEHWIHDTFAESPILRSHLERRRTWYLWLWPVYEAWRKSGAAGAIEPPGK